MSGSLLAAIWPRVRPVLLALLAFYLLLVLFAWIFQRRLIYLPDARAVVPPSGPAWKGLRALTLRAEDGVDLHAWYWPGERPGTVLVFHGNAGNRGDRASWMRGIHNLGYGVFLPDYRGYGGSGGSPSEAGLYLDAACCHRWLTENAPGPVVYLGSSIGSGVACELACREAPAGLVLQGSFSSLADVAGSAYPILPVRWLLSDRYDNRAKIGDAACPLLMFHGDDDRIAPIALARGLFEAAPGPKQWVEVEGAGHNDLVTVAGDGYWLPLARFLSERLGR